MVSGIDLVLLLLLAISVFNGIRKGLIAALIGLLGWVVGVIAAIRWHGLLLPWMASFSDQPMIQHAMAFAAVVLLIVLVLSIVGWLADKTLNQLKLGWLNRVVGGLFAFCKTVLVFAIFIHILSAWFGGFQWWQQSQVIGAISPYAATLSSAAQQAAQRVSNQVHQSISSTDERSTVESNRSRDNPFQ